MKSDVQIGIIGVGNRSLDIIKGILGAKGIQIVAVSDPCEESVERALNAIPYRPKVCSSNEELLSLDLDGVIVAAPNDLHPSLAKQVLSSGKALYLEKPMAISVEQCEEIENYAREKNAPMMIGMQLRYSDVYRKMKKLCDEGVIGDIKMIFFRALRNRFRQGVEGWRLQKNRSGGMVLEVSVHQLDLFNWFADSRIEKVVAFAGKDANYQSEELYDNAVVTIQYENGVKANLQAGVFAPQGGDDVGMCIVGTKGTMYETRQEIVVKLPGGDSIRYSTSGYAQMDMYAMEAFRDLIAEKIQPKTSPEAGREAVRLAVLAEQSAESGMVVSAL